MKRKTAFDVIRDEIISDLDSYTIEIFDWDFCDRLENLAREKNSEYRDSDFYREACAKERKEQIKRADARHARDEKVKKWVSENIKIGDIVKFKGTRDRFGFREIVDLHHGVAISGRKFEPVHQEINAEIYLPCKKKLKPFRMTHLVTTHGHEKVVSVYKKKLDMTVEQIDMDLE